MIRTDLFGLRRGQHFGKLIHLIEFVKQNLHRIRSFPSHSLVLLGYLEGCAQSVSRNLLPHFLMSYVVVGVLLRELFYVAQMFLFRASIFEERARSFRLLPIDYVAEALLIARIELVVRYEGSGRI